MSSAVPGQRSARSQEDLKAAIADGVATIHVDSPPDVWLMIADQLRSNIIVIGSSRVVAWGSARVEAWDSVHVVARGSAHVEARGSARVEARGSAHVEACDSAHVEARGSARVVARDSVRIEASAHVAIHRHSPLVTVCGGVVIDIAALDLTDPATWADYEGVHVRDGVAVVYKATSPELMAGQRNTPTHYAIGSTVVAGDWDPAPWCGNGLHFSPHPRLAAANYQGHEPRDQVRYLACEIDITDAVPLGDKIKSESCRVLHEVDINGAPIGGAA